MSNITTATFEDGCVTTITKELWQWDYGQILQFPNLELPESYEVHFGNTVVGLAPIQIGNADGVQIPDILLAQPEAITAWVFLHVGDSDGETRYQVTIPVIPRAKPFTGDVPPVQQSAITQAISLLNSAVDDAEESAAAASQSATDAAGSASSASASAMQANRNAAQSSSAATGAASSASIAGQNASIATSKAEQADQSAGSAAAFAQQASGSAMAASAAATSASSSASAAASEVANAAGYASQAADSATDAAASKSGAAVSASQASRSAMAASNAATSAASSASTAGQNASIATSKAEQAAASATAAATSASDAESAAANIQQTVDDALQAAKDSGEFDGPAGPAGPTGPAGPRGDTGATGPAGPGLPAGGTIGQIPVKASSTDYEVAWSNGLIDLNTIALGAYPTGVVSGNIASIVDGADGMPVKSLQIEINPLQSGSGDPSPTNVRPISGWTGAKIIRCGGNLLGFMNSRASNGITFTVNNDLSVTVNGTATSNAYNDGTMNIENASKGYPLLPAGTYIMPLPPYGSNWKWYVGAISPDGTQVIAPKAIAYNSSDSVRSLVLTEQAYVYVRIQVVDGTTVDNEVAYPAVYHIGYEPYTWEQYKSDTYTCDWSDAISTVYGGTLDVTTGVLTVDRAIVDLGTLSWQVFSASPHDRFGTNGLQGLAVIPPTDSTLADILCSAYPIDTATHVYNHVIAGSVALGANGRLYCYDPSYSTSADFKAAMSGVQLCYKLISPITYTLTPVEVLTMLGANTIYADTGGTSVIYRADPTLYADRRSNSTRSLIAGIETTMTASKAYSAGDLLIVGDTLYKVTTAISNGATFTPGTNVTATTVVEQLLLLANA